MTTDRNSIPVRENDGSGEFGAGREGGHHPQPDGGPDLQHGLRPGRGGRAAGQPDALQPVLSRKSGSSSSKAAASSISPAAVWGLRAPTDVSEAPHASSYSRRIGLEGDAERGAVVVPIHGGAPHDGEGGRVRRRPAEHPDGGVARGGHGVDELHGAPPAAGRPAPQQHWRDIHEPLGVARRSRCQPGVRGRRHVLVSRDPRLRDPTTRVPERPWET